MKATMTSINPPHTTNIFEGRKIVEWRTFALPEGLHYIYETKRCFGLGMVIGTLEISRNYTFNTVDEIPDYLIDAGCVPRDFLRAYAKGRRLFANVIYDAKRFENPQPLDSYFKYNEDTLRCNKSGYFSCHNCGKSCRVVRAPQCYCFIQV